MYFDACMGSGSGRSGCASCLVLSLGGLATTIGMITAIATKGKAF